MALSKVCETLKQNRVGECNSGIQHDPESDDDIIITNKAVVDYCLMCKLPECLAKKRDDKKMGVRV